MNLASTAAFCLTLAATLSSCAKPSITVKREYDFDKVKRIALIDFRDHPGDRGSGELVSSIFQKYLLELPYQVVERSQVKQVMKEQTFSLSGAVDPTTARKLGRLLGVDALILGNITAYRESEESTTYTDVKEEVREPVIEKRVKRVKRGEEWVTEEKDVVTGYTVRARRYQTPQTRITEARVGLAARMVDAETGQVLWAATYSKQAYDLPEAADAASRNLVRAVKKMLFPKRRGDGFDF